MLATLTWINSHKHKYVAGNGSGLVQIEANRNDFRKLTYMYFFL